MLGIGSSQCVKIVMHTGYIKLTFRRCPSLTINGMILTVAVVVSKSAPSMLLAAT